MASTRRVRHRHGGSAGKVADVYGVANAKTSEERSRQVRGMGETNEARVTAATNLVIAWQEAINAKPEERTR